MVIKEGPKRFKELIHWGQILILIPNGNYDLGKEGGHSEYRVVHHKDITGYEIERALLQRAHQLKNVNLLPHHFAIDLITEHHLNVLTQHIYPVMVPMCLNENTSNTYYNKLKKHPISFWRYW